MSDRRLFYGDYSIDIAGREVFRSGMRLALPVKVFDCIVYLAIHADRAVGRDELISAIWGRVDVSDNLLAQLILRARRVFEDGGDGQRFIRTIPGFGYRWVHEPGAAPVAPSTQDVEAALPEPDAAVTLASSPPTPEVTRGPLWRTATLAITIAAIVVGALIFFVRSSNRIVPSASAAAPLTLVLPAVLRGEPDYAWARLGIMDLLSQRLRDAGVTTVPSESVVALSKFAGATPTPAELDELSATTGARRVLQTDISRAQQTWTVRVEMAHGEDAPAGANGESADLLAAADAAIGQLISRLNVRGGAANPATPLDAVVQEVESAILSDQFDQARRLIQAAPTDMQRDPRLRLQLSRLDLVGGHIDSARTALEALSHEEAVRRDPFIAAKVLSLLASAELRSNDFLASEKAADAAVQALKGKDGAVTGNALGNALIARATAYSAQGAAEKAMDDFAAARIVLAATGNVRLQANADVNYSVLEIDRGHFREASPPLARAADLFRRMRLPSSELTARMNLMSSYIALQNLEGAAEEEARVSDLVARSGDPIVRWIAESICAQSAHEQGRLTQGEAILRSIADSEVTQQKGRKGQLAAIDAQFALARGDWARAQTSAQEALGEPWDTEEPRDFARVWWTLVRADRHAAADHGEATASRARAWAAATKTPTASLYAALTEAEYRSGLASDKQAGALYEQALAAATQLDVPIDIVAVTTSYANWLMSFGDTTRAAGVLRRNEAWSSASFPTALAYVRLYRAMGNQPLWQAALKQAQAIAGERPIPDELTQGVSAPN